MNFTDTLSAERIIDPRPRAIARSLSLAKRMRLEDLKKEKLLILDNTKLDLGNYRTVLTTLESRLKRKGFQKIEIFRQTIRGKNGNQIKQMAGKMAGLGAKAAILTLSDMGVSPAMVLLAIALEEAGIPTVCVTAGPGIQLAQAVAYYRAGRLCLVGLDLYPGSTATQIEKEVSDQVNTIVEMLCGWQEEIEAKTLIDNIHEQPPPASDGYLIIEANTDFGEHLKDGHEGKLKAVYNQFEKNSIGDGLPVIPPTEERVARIMRYCSVEPDHIFGSDIGPTGSPITARDLAINAVMAGCKPEYMPVLVTAMTALCDPAYNLFQSITTSHGGGNLILISGPLAAEIGINSGQGCLGPGTRANATIGRAVNLTLRNSCRVITGFSDLSCLSSPAEYSYCFAESIENSPWATINAERYGPETTTVSVLMAESPHNIVDFASSNGDGFLETVSDCCTSLGSNNAYLPGTLVVVLAPNHAQLLVKDGFDKNSIRQYLHDKVGNRTEKLIKRGFVGMGPKDEKIDPFFKATRSPKDIEVVVAGGKGGHSCVIIPWSLHSDLVVKPIQLPDGTIPQSVKDFQKAHS